MPFGFPACKLPPEFGETLLRRVSPSSNVNLQADRRREEWKRHLYQKSFLFIYMFAFKRHAALVPHAFTFMEVVRYLL